MTNSTQNQGAQDMTNDINTYDGKSIRQALKTETGYNARQVTVRVETYSMGHSVHFTIRDASVSYKTLEEFVKTRIESIRRCHVSGEILGGGNTYTHIHVKDEVAEEWAAPLVPQIEAARKRWEGYESDSCGEPVNDDLMIWGGHFPGDGDFHLTGRGDLSARTCFYTANAEGFKRAAIQAVTDILQK